MKKNYILKKCAAFAFISCLAVSFASCENDDDDSDGKILQSGNEDGNNNGEASQSGNGDNSNDETSSHTKNYVQFGDKTFELNFATIYNINGETGKGSGVYTFVTSVYDQYDPEADWGEEGYTFELTLRLNSDDANELQAGSYYTSEKDGEKNTIEIANSSSQWCPTATAETPQYYDFEKGTVDIFKKGEIYDINFSLIDVNGTELKGNYYGILYVFE